MPLTQFLVMGVIAVLVTVPVVLLIPRARASTTFDRLLWVATAFVGFLIAWVAVGMGRNSANPGGFVIGDTPILPAFIGALAGALAVNLPLSLLDRFEHREEEAVPEELRDQLAKTASEEQEKEEATADEE